MFCRNCGKDIRDNAQFCAHCGTSQSVSPIQYAQKPVQQEPVQPPSYTPHVIKQKKGGGFLLLFAVICLFLFGVGQMALSIAGKTTRGYITRYEQRMYLNHDESTRNPNRYEVYYEFTANGERYTGTTTKIFNRGIIASSDGTAKPITVKYFPLWPHLNSEDDGKHSLSGLLMIGLGFLLLVFYVKGRKSKA